MGDVKNGDMTNDPCESRANRAMFTGYGAQLPGWIAEELGWLLPEPWDLAGQCHWRPGSAVFLVFDCHGCTVMYQDIYIFHIYIYISIYIYIYIYIIIYIEFENLDCHSCHYLSICLNLPISLSMPIWSGWPSRGGWTMLWTPRYSRLAGTGPSKHKDNRCNTW